MTHLAWRSQRYLSFSMGAVAASIFPCGPAYAQVAAAASTDDSALDDQSGLGDIIVTAQKRSENLQNVPIAITAVTGATLEASGVRDTAAIGNVSPGVVISSVTSVPALYIRGVGTQNTFAGEESSNSIYVDGVYYGSLSATAFKLSSVERIEVLKGPQGTLFGRNATGGLIHVITREPTHDAVAQARVGYANYDTWTGSGYVSGSLSPKLAMNFAADYEHQGDGWGQDITTGKDIFKSKSFTARAKLLWEPTSELRILVTGDYFFERSSRSGGRSIIPGAVSIIGTTAATAPFGRYDIRTDMPDQSLKSQGGGLSARVSYEATSFEVVSLSAYRKSKFSGGFDQDGTALPIVKVSYDQPAEQYSQELQIQSLPSSAVRWITGLFYLHNDENSDPLGITGSSQAPFGGFLNRFGNLRTRSIAGYGQATIPVTDEFNITAGARYTRDHKRLIGRNVSGLVVNPVTNITDISKTWNKLTYRLALDYNVSDDVLLYASLSRGYKSGGFSASNVANPPIEPETLDALEGGFKSEWLDRKLRLNASAFYYDYKNLQLSQIITGTALIVNAAKAKMHGVDSELLVEPIDHLQLRGSFSYLFGEYGNFPNAPARLVNPIGIVPPGFVCPAVLPTRPGGSTACTLINARGNRLIRTPKTTLSLGINYRLPTSLGEFAIDASYYHNSGYFFEVDNRLRQPAYSLINGQLSWTSRDRRFDVRIWARNLTDEAYFQNLSSAVGDNGTYEAPRTYGFSLGVRL